MLPFLPPFANQNQVQRGNDPPPNLFTRSSGAIPNQFGFNNPRMLMPAMGGFNNQNAFLSTLLTQQHMFQGLQNNLMGALLQQGMMPQLPGQQLNLLGALQNPNFMSLQHGELSGRPPMGQNLNQMLGFSPNGLLGLQNPIFPPNTQLPVIGSGNSNPVSLENGSTVVGQSSSSSKVLETQITRQKLQEPNLPGRVQTNMSNNGRQWPQHGELSSRPPMGQNLNHMLGFSPNGLLGLQNPIFPPNTQLPVIGSGNSNPVLLENGSTVVGQSLSSLKVLETQITRQKLQEPNLPGPVQNNMSNNRRHWPQMTHGQTGGKNFSNNSDNVASNNFNPKFHEKGKMEPSHMRFQKSYICRFQKSQSYNSRNAGQKERIFAKNNRRGQHPRKERTTTFSASNTPNLRKRPLSEVYNESEIQQWREARKNNFPTRANIDKKLKSESASKEEMDSLAKMLRQQLKEVLAKQAELGVEVAEIPSIYLSKPEDQNSKIANPDEALNTNIEAPYKDFTNRKRARFQRNKRNAKRLKLKNETAPAEEPVVKKREPTLLRKLLNADIRRDKSQLLQAFRFMVLNSFFKSVPDKPLVFPIITARNAQPESEKKPLDSDTNFRVENGNPEEVEREKDSALVGAVQSEGDEDNDSDGVSDVVYEPNGEDVISHGGEKSEEGEITD